MIDVPIESMLQRYFVLEQKEKEMPIPLWEISEESFIKFKKGTFKLYEFKYFTRKILEVKLNYIAYEESVIRHNNHLLILKQQQRNINEYLDFCHVDINRLFTNAISSLKSLLEHFETRLKKKYGKSSEEVIRFKEYNSNNYDTFLSHRLLVNMRNYAHHHDFPIEYVDFEVDYMNEIPHTSKLEMQFSKKKILDSGIAKKLMGDIKDLNERIPVYPYLVEIQNYVNTLENKFIEFEFYHLATLAKSMIALFERSERKKNIHIGYLEKKGRGFLWKMSRLEIEICNRIIDET